MNDRAPSYPREAHEAASHAPLATPFEGVSTSVFAGIAVVAVAARVIAPALPGSATGIEGLISAMHFVAACSSQLIAAGGIALCLRALSGLWPWPNLGVALRLLVVPVTLAVVAFTVSSAARPLAAESVRIAALAAVVASGAAAPLLCSSERTRTLGIVLFLTALAGVFALAAYEFSVHPSALFGEKSARVSAALSLFFDVAATLFALAWSGVTTRARLLGIGLTLAATLGVALIARGGAGRTAHASLIVLYRSLESLANRPGLALPTLLAEAGSLLPLAGTVALLVMPGRRPELRATLALCLVGRTVTGAPVAALLSVAAVLTALGAWLHGTPRPARVSNG